MKRIVRAISGLLMLIMLITTFVGCSIKPPSTAIVNNAPTPTALPADIDINTVDYVIPIWRALEITFVSLISYKTAPIYDINMDVTFTAADGTTILMPAFWDGGTTWKVRVSLEFRV